MKGQTFSELFPKGICFLCKEPCHPEAILHRECTRAYDQYKDQKLKELEEKK